MMQLKTLDDEEDTYHIVIHCWFSK
jgi:hypothetical protein